MDNQLPPAPETELPDRSLQEVIQDLESMYVRDARRRQKSLMYAHDVLLESVLEAALSLKAIEQNLNKTIGGT